MLNLNRDHRVTVKKHRNVGICTSEITPKLVFCSQLNLRYSEEKLYNYNHPGFTMATGHFTQVSLYISRSFRNQLLTISYWKQLAK